MDLRIIEWFQTIRHPILDWFFYVVTYLGDQYFFIALAAILYWTYDKKFAHKFTLTFLISVFVNTGFKQVFQRARPYTYDGIESVFTETQGYSFPSGHAQASGVIGFTAYERYQKTGYKLLKYFSIFILIMVPLSRVYLAQHFVTDVLVGLVLSLGIAYFVFRYAYLMGDREDLYTLAFIPILIILMLFIPQHDLYIGAGGFIGFAGGYFLEKRYLQYEVKNTLLIQILKVIIGIAVAFGLKEGLKLIFLDTLFFDFLRYLMIGAWAAIGAPVVFKYVFKNNTQENLS